MGRGKKRTPKDRGEGDGWQVYGSEWQEREKKEKEKRQERTIKRVRKIEKRTIKRVRKIEKRTIKRLRRIEKRKRKRKRKKKKLRKIEKRRQKVGGYQKKPGGRLEERGPERERKLLPHFLW